MQPGMLRAGQLHGVLDRTAEGWFLRVFCRVLPGQRVERFGQQTDRPLVLKHEECLGAQWRRALGGAWVE